MFSIVTSMTLAMGLGLSMTAHAGDISAADFQTTEKDTKFAAFIQTLDLSAPEVIYEFKSTGTSVGLKLAIGDEKIGKYMPTNSAANPESQRVSYSLGRFLYMSDLVPPSSYYELSGRALIEFKDMLENSVEKNKWRKYNQEMVLAEIAKNPNGLDGIFVDQVKGEAEVEGLADTAHNTINASHPIATFIRADGPAPTAQPMSLKGVKAKDGSTPVASELELATQFSKIMILDALIGQWDRWSGGNVEAIAGKSGSLKFMARDNGGGGMVGTKATEKNLKFVTRFDRKQVDRIIRLQELLEADPVTVAKALDLRSDVRHLKNRVALVLLHIKNQSELYGAAAFF